MQVVRARAVYGDVLVLGDAEMLANLHPRRIRRTSFAKNLSGARVKLKKIDVIGPQSTQRILDILFDDGA